MENRLTFACQGRHFNPKVLVGSWSASSVYHLPLLLILFCTCYKALTQLQQIQIADYTCQDANVLLLQG